MKTLCEKYGDGDMARYSFFEGGKLIAEAYDYEAAKRLAEAHPLAEWRGDGDLIRPESKALDGEGTDGSEDQEEPFSMIRSFLALISLILLTGLLGSGLSAAENPTVSNLGTPPKWKGWDRMTVTQPDFMAKDRKTQIPDFLMKIWAKEIAANDRQYREQKITGPGGKSLFSADGHAPADALYSVYEDGDRKVIVSMLFSLVCEDGPNDYGSDQIHSLCPLRITVVRGHDSRSIDYRDGCFLDITYGNPPGGPDPLTNASLTRFDRAAGLVELIAIRDGKSLPGCVKRLKVPGR